MNDSPSDARMSQGAQLGGQLPSLDQSLAAVANAAGPMITPGTGWVTRHGLDSAGYQAEFNKWTQAGYRLVHVGGYDTPAGARYVGIWEKSDGPAWVARHGLSAASYQSTFTSLVNQGYRLRTVSGYTDRGVERYAAIWEKTGGPAWVARHGLSAADYQSTFTSLVNQGYRLKVVSGYTVGSEVRYAAIWERTGGPEWAARHGQTSAEHQATFNSMLAAGYRPVYVTGYATVQGVRFASIYERVGGPAWESRHNLASQTYQESVNVWALWGLRPLTVAGYHDGTRARFATIWVGDGPAASSLVSMQGVFDSFVHAHSIGASQFAIATGGRLVYSRAFGLADPAASDPVTIRHRFRIASISKPITAAAIFALVDAGRLSIDQTVFGAGALLGTTYGTKAYGANLKAITVRHLLEHSVGTWANDGNDPMFLANNLSQADIISKMIDDRPPAAAPGGTHVYSNFGYCVLGRVIEAVTGQSYAASTGSVLARAGVSRAAIAGNTLAERQVEEVIYEGRGGQNPYGMNVRRMDAHGGWIATAADLVRFALHVDGRTPPGDILSSASQKAMDLPSAASPTYARGWSVNGANRWHTGSLPGTTSILVRTGDLCWAGLLNTRDDTLVEDLDALMWDAVGKVSSWPTGQLAG